MNSQVCSQRNAHNLFFAKDNIRTLGEFGNRNGVPFSRVKQFMIEVWNEFVQWPYSSICLQQENLLHMNRMVYKKIWAEEKTWPIYTFVSGKGMVNNFDLNAEDMKNLDVRNTDVAVITPQRQRYNNEIPPWVVGTIKRPYDTKHIGEGLKAIEKVMYNERLFDVPALMHKYGFGEDLYKGEPLSKLWNK